MRISNRWRRRRLETPLREFIRREMATWVVFDQQVDVVVVSVASHEGGAEVGADLGEDVIEEVEMFRAQHAPPVLRHEDQMDVERRNHAAACCPR